MNKVDQRASLNFQVLVKKHRIQNPERVEKEKGYMSAKTK